MNKIDIINSCLEGVIFESWLRFQFLDGKDNNLKIVIPEPWKMEIRSLNSSLQKIADKLASHTPALADSREAILEYMNEILNGQSDAEVSIQEILIDPDFLEKLDQYHLWLDKNKEILPVMEFSTWLKQFNRWLSAQKIAR